MFSYNQIKDEEREKKDNNRTDMQVHAIIHKVNKYLLNVHTITTK